MHRRSEEGHSTNAKISMQTCLSMLLAESTYFHCKGKSIGDHDMIVSMATSPAQLCGQPQT